MDIKDIRLANLRTLVERHDSIRAFAEAVGSSGSYISQILSPNIDATMGNALARQIEERLALPNGWVDTNRDYRNPQLLPFIAWDAQGGLSVAELAALPASERDFAAPREVGPAAYYTRADSAAMAPVVQLGDCLVVDPAVPLEANKIVVVRSAAGRPASLRRLAADGGAWRLLADNPQFPGLPLDDPGAVLGAVVAVVKML